MTSAKMARKWYRQGYKAGYQSGRRAGSRSDAVPVTRESESSHAMCARCGAEWFGFGPEPVPTYCPFCEEKQRTSGPGSEDWHYPGQPASFHAEIG